VRGPIEPFGAEVQLEQVERIAIFGAGTMGPSLAQVFATAGYQVALYSRTAETLGKAMSLISANLATFAERSLVSWDAVEAIVARISPTRSVEEAGGDADLVIETIVENREAKQTLCEQLDAVCPDDAVLTSDTSYLNIFEIMPARRLTKTIIAHWFAPPQIIPLVEVVKGPETSEETVALVVDLIKHVGHVPSVMDKFVPGFCVTG
jgi:3-hydroxyacyl-CoA dehydrogenase